MKRKLIMLAGCVLILFINACKKDISRPSTSPKTISSSTPIPDGYTMTMVGLLPDSNVTVIEEGYKLSFENGHAYKVNIASGARIRDLGELMPRFVNRNSAPNLLAPPGRNSKATTPGLTFGNSGQAHNWITYGIWQNTSGNPITNFTTTWTVPSAPPNPGTNELFAIWMGLEPTDSTFPQPTGQQYPLIQPLLIWGNSGGRIGGGNYWTIVSYIVWENSNETLSVAVSTAVPNVAPGTVLQAQISLTEGSGTYDAVCQFVGQSQTYLPITEGQTLNLNPGGTAPAPMIPALNYAAEVLEIPGAPYITSLNEYPNIVGVSMNSISITTGSTNPTVNWVSSSADNLPNGAALGEHTNIVNSSNLWLDFQASSAPSFTYFTPNDLAINNPVTPLNPTVNGPAPVSYSVSPALPAKLSISSTTGVISGTPTVLSPAANYTISAVGQGGNIGTFTTNIVVANAYPFVVSSGSSSTTIYNLVFNGNTVATANLVTENDVNNLTLVYTPSSNSTVVFQAQSGYMPVSGTLYGNFAPINGTVNANKNTGLTTITFTGVNLNGAQCQIVID